MLKQPVFLIATLILVAAVVTLFVFNTSLRGDVGALTDTLSRASQTELALKTENEELKRQLLQQQDELESLTESVEPLKKLVAQHVAKITTLVSQIETLEAVASTSDSITSQVAESTVVSDQVEVSGDVGTRQGR